MSTNLRLSPAAADALRTRAKETRRSQQELLREAVDQYLGLTTPQTELDQLIRAGIVSAPTPFIDCAPTESLPEGMSILDLLDRDSQR
ncbi:MAG: ribbon-helix-helix protein, CopG family [Angustibacter sp.]